MSEDGFWECCGEILLTIGLAFFFAWCEEDPSGCTMVGMALLGTMMAGLPVYWFIKDATLKKGIVVGYFISFFAWIIAIILGIVGNIFAILGVCMFLGIGTIGLAYLIVAGKMKKRRGKRFWSRGEKRGFEVTYEYRPAAFPELGYDLMELKEQLGRGAITQEEYEHKKRLLEALKELNEQLLLGAITLEEYEQKKKKLLDKYQAR